MNRTWLLVPLLLAPFALVGGFFWWATSSAKQDQADRDRVARQFEAILDGWDVPAHNPWGGRWEVQRTGGLLIRVGGLPAWSCHELATVWRHPGLDGVLRAEINGQPVPANPRHAHQAHGDATCRPDGNTVVWRLVPEPAPESGPA